MEDEKDDGFLDGYAVLGKEVLPETVPESLPKTEKIKKTKESVASALGVEVKPVKQAYAVHDANAVIRRTRLRDGDECDNCGAKTTKSVSLRDD